MSEDKKPAILVFAGPNGSGKSTITSFSPLIGDYINADDIKRVCHCSDMDAALFAEKMRRSCLKALKDFAFETVLSTDRNLILLEEAKASGYFIKGVFVLTKSPEINISRVKARVRSGGHDVPEIKIRSRYEKSILNLPRFIKVCDVAHVYDNSEDPCRIFKKKFETFTCFDNEIWSKEAVLKLCGLT